MNQSGQKISARPETKMALKPEYAGYFSLCPAYFVKQLRQVEEMQREAHSILGFTGTPLSICNWISNGHSVKEGN